MEQAKPYLDMGVRHFCVGWDVGVVFGWCKEQAKVLEELGLKYGISKERVRQIEVSVKLKLKKALAGQAEIFEG